MKTVKTLIVSFFVVVLGTLLFFTVKNKRTDEQLTDKDFSGDEDFEQIFI